MEITWDTVGAITGLLVAVVGVSTVYIRLLISNKAAEGQKDTTEKFVELNKDLKDTFMEREVLEARFKLLETRMTATCACVAAAFPDKED